MKAKNFISKKKNMSVSFANDYQIDLADRDLDEIAAQIQSFVPVIVYSYENKLNFWKTLDEVPTGFTLIETHNWPRYYLLRSQKGEEYRLSSTLAMNKMTQSL